MSQDRSNGNRQAQSLIPQITIDLCLQQPATAMGLIFFARLKRTMGITEWNEVCDTVEARGGLMDKALADFLREFNPVIALRKAGLL